jgi:hypothetical protein
MHVRCSSVHPSITTFVQIFDIDVFQIWNVVTNVRVVPPAFVPVTPTNATPPASPHKLMRVVVHV